MRGVLHLIEQDLDTEEWLEAGWVLMVAYLASVAEFHRLFGV